MLTASNLRINLTLPPLSVHLHSAIPAYNDERLNRTKKDYPKDKNLILLFEEQAKKTPDKTAIIYQDQQVTYNELNNKANQLAHFIKSKGISSGGYIALYFERSVESIVAFLAILKSGNAYIPIDKDAPLTLMENIIDDSKISTILTSQEFSETANKLADRVQALVIDLDKQAALIEQESVGNLDSYPSTDLVYVLYTSGSTGKPKGVQISHKSLVNLLFAMREEVAFTEQDILLAITPLTFDISGLELYMPLITGATFIFANNVERLDPRYIIKNIAKRNVTIMQATPVTWQMLMNVGWKNEHRIKMLCGGEGLKTQLASQLCATGAPLWNLYGPTETTIWSTSYKVTHIDNTKPLISIGQPIANTQIYILDENLLPVSIGVPGELYIGGDGVGVGYLNNPQLTQQRFVADPFLLESGKKLYKTGDIVVLAETGELHYMGRIDAQIKVRGHRIEAEAIENLLMKYEDILGSVVLDKGPAKEHELVAYVILKKTTISLTSVRDYLRSYLPEYMIPTKFIAVTKFPLTPNGKIDRKNLPNITDFNYLHVEILDGEPVQNIYEVIIVNALRKLLKVGVVNIQANFFDLGAYSLLLVELSSILSKELNRDIQVTEIFAYPTVRLLASYLNKEEQIETINIMDEIQRRADSKRSRIIKKRVSYVG